MVSSPRDEAISSALAPPGKSILVTVVAWIFIILSGSAMPISIFQNIVVALSFGNRELEGAMNQGSGQPAWLESIVAHVPLFFHFVLVVLVITLVASIGLLLRRNWARLLFITVMGLGIAWNVSTVAFTAFFFSSVGGIAGIRHEAPMAFDFVYWAIVAVSVAQATGFSCLFGWIIWKLMSVKIRHEFPGAIKA